MLDSSPAVVKVSEQSSHATVNDDYKKKSPAFQPQPWCGQHLTGQKPAPLKNVYNYAQMDECKEKTPMCRIAELARFNKLKHEYKLMDESGPAHKKRFTVSLILTPDQVFDGCGASIKKAQQAAADAALKATTLPRPPERHQPKKLKKDPRNPLILLSYVTHHLGIEPIFTEMGAPTYTVPPSFISSPNRQMSCGYMPMIDERFMVPPPPPSATFAHICPPPPVPMILSANSVIPGYAPQPPQRVYQVRLVLNNEMPEFIGKGPTKQKAKLNAATQALLHLGPTLVTLEAQLKNSNSNNNNNTHNHTNDGNLSNGKQMTLSKMKSIEDYSECSDESIGSESENGGSPVPDLAMQTSMSTNRNGKPKSAISQIHECALQMRMNVEFEILKEEGPAHERHYLLRCKMISPNEVIIADGEGGSKKIAKQNACALMLTKLKSLETSPIFIASSIFKSQKKTTASKEAKRKTIIKDMKMDPDYGHQINPVSRLMQVMQARKDTEPKFQLIAEHGQSRYKEFVVEVTCGEELRCEGTGPNKKLAKRAAAEAMLARIGYVKPMPKPGKSLLKKRNDACRIVDSEQPKPLEIGVFNADELITSSQTNSMTTSVNESDDSNARNDSENSPKESVSEVTLSVTATIGSQVMTFADVDQTARADDHHTVWGSAAAAAESTSFPDVESRNVTNECENDDTNKSSTKPATPANKRHVTFSNEVSACPPPDDSNYPSALITPLKSEMLFVSKMRKRGRDSKKLLSDEQKREMAEMAREFLTGWNAAENASLVKAYAENAPKIDNSIGMFVLPHAEITQKMSNLSIGSPIVANQQSANHTHNSSSHVSFWPNSGDPNAPEALIFESAKRRLERIAEMIKFSINFSDFPKAQNESEQQYFSLVSLGIQKPLVCHGSGVSEEAAHDNAAYNALVALSTYDLQNVSD